MRDEGIEIEVSAADRARLPEAIVADRNSPQKHVWRALDHLWRPAKAAAPAAVHAPGGRVEASACGAGRQRFIAEGVDGVLRDKTRPSRIAPLPKAAVERALTDATLEETPPEGVTHWTAAGRWPRPAGSASARCERIWRAARAASPIRSASFKLLDRSQLCRQGRRHRRARIVDPTAPCRGAVGSTRKAKSRPSTAPSRVCP